jgi:small-conductance mechanosensitive channel
VAVPDAADPSLWVPGNRRNLSRERWQEAEGTPVRFDGQVLFEIRAGAGDLTPAARARAIEARLRAIAAQDAPLGPARIEDGEFSDVFVGDRFVVSLADADVGAAGAGRLARAQQVARGVRAALDAYRRDRSPAALLRSGIETAVATAILVLFLVAIRLLRRTLGRRLAGAAESLLARLRIQNQPLVGPEARARAVAWTGHALRIALAVVAVFVWLQVVLHRFPRTRDPADRSLHFVLGAVAGTLQGIFGFLPNLVYIAIFTAIGFGASRATEVVFAAVQRGAIRLPGFYPEWAIPTSRIVRFLVFAMVAVAVLPYLPGAGSSAFQAIGIFLGAVISLGSGSSVSNAIAGLVLTYMRPFAVGDFVKVGDATGTVTEHGALAVRILTIRNESVTLPASIVLASQIVNYSEKARTAGVALRTSVTIGYDVPWRRVHELLLEAAGRTTGVQAQPAPWVIQTALSDFYVCYELDVYVGRPEVSHLILSELNQNVQDAFFRAGVEILSPHYAQLRDGNKAAIPDEWLPAGERTRAFKVSAVVRDAAPADPVPAGRAGGDGGAPPGSPVPGAGGAGGGPGAGAPAAPPGGRAPAGT